MSGILQGVIASIGGAVRDVYFNLVTLLLPGNGTNGAQNNTFIDSSTNNLTVIRNGTLTQGTFSPFSQTGWSNYFDGTGDYLSVADNAALNFGTGDLTVEGWVYMSALPASQFPIAGKFNPGSPFVGWELLVQNTGVPRIWFGTSYLIAASSALSVGSWNHLAMVRSGSTVTLWVNGVSAGSATSSTDVNNSGTCFIGNEYNASNGLIGYLSNVRVVKGTALYTSTFTPSTTPLTAVSGTSLLTCQSNRFLDNSTNNFAITANGDVSVQAFSPFLPSDEYKVATVGGSAGRFITDNYLGFNNTSFAFGTNNFTIEFWIYFIPSESVTSFGTFFDNGNQGVFLSWGSSINNILFYSPSVGQTNTAGYPHGMAKNTWNHVAYVRNSTTVTIYVNGNSVGAYTGLTGSATGTGSLATVGAYTAAPSSYPPGGFMSGFRIVNSAVYTSNFAVPTSPPTAISGTSLLLNFTNASITDATAKNDLQTAGNTQISTAQSKFGGSSIYFDGTGDYLGSNAAASTSDLYAFGTGDFTIECWIRFDLVNTIQIIYDSRPSSTQGDYPTLYLNSNGTIRFFAGSVDRITSSGVSANTWYHLAVSRSGTSTRMFIDGTQTGSTYTDSTTYLNSSGRPWIGLNAFNTTTQGLSGYIDDFRVTKGFARYTANFTPPTTAFPLQ